MRSSSQKCTLLQPRLLRRSAAVTLGAGKRTTKGTRVARDAWLMDASPNETDTSVGLAHLSCIEGRSRRCWCHCERSSARESSRRRGCHFGCCNLGAHAPSPHPKPHMEQHGRRTGRQPLGHSAMHTVRQSAHAAALGLHVAQVWGWPHEHSRTHHEAGSPCPAGHGSLVGGLAVAFRHGCRARSATVTPARLPYVCGPCACISRNGMSSQMLAHVIKGQGRCGTMLVD